MQSLKFFRRMLALVLLVCTACGKEIFWSHRKMGTARGSMAALIQRGGEI